MRCANCGHEVKKYHGKWYHSHGYLVHKLTLKCSNCDCRTPYIAIKPSMEWFVIKFWNKIKYKLNEKPYYNRFSSNKFFTSLVWMVILSLTFAVLYTNIDVINKIVILFPLGNILLLINGIFWFKYTYQTLKGVVYWYGDQRNWIKCLTVLIILSLAWQSYQQKETIFNPLIDFTNKNPVKFDLNPIIELHNKTASFFEPPNPERKNQSKEALEYLNQIRKKYGREELLWDDRIYRLAVFRSKDMLQKKYFDHVTPEGKCAEDFKKDFSITEYGSFAENLGGMTSYEDGETFKVNVEGITYYIGGEPAPDTNVKEAIDGWMESRGHRYALLYPYKDYKKSAIGCYKSICTFLVLTTEPFQCASGDEGLAYWKSIDKQPGEI